MNFIVWKLVGEKNSKYHPRQRYFRYVLKGMDDEKSYYLNLPLNHQSKTYLTKILQEGNIVKADLQTNKNNISYFSPILLVKEAKRVK